MDKAARCELLRSLFQAKAGSFAYRHSGKALRPNTDPVEGPGFGVWGKGGLCLKPYEPMRAEGRESRETVRTRRTGRKSALTRIAERYHSATYRAETKRLDLRRAYR